MSEYMHYAVVQRAILTWIWGLGAWLYQKQLKDAWVSQLFALLVVTLSFWQLYQIDL